MALRSDGADALEPTFQRSSQAFPNPRVYSSEATILGLPNAMRRLIAIGITLLVGTGAAAGVAAPVTTADGWLAGRTQISYGCPGPVRKGYPSCDPWRMFAHARFSVALEAANGSPIPSTSRLVVSDGQGRFSLRLPAGRYAVTPLPQAHTRGGTRLRVRVEAGAVTRVLVRFQGFPMML
jgi:hypothetical protein